MEYVQAAIALGASKPRIIFRHILPNVFHLIIIHFSLAFGGLVMSETFLTDLGIGVSDKDKSWGSMIKAAQNEMTRDPIIFTNFIAASVAIFLLVLAFNIFGDALRDALDPRIKD
jgi:peptide/nickel transport system permease protein